MGMFDWIECDWPLPDEYVPERRDMQSKDLDCNLDVVRITVDGRLIAVASTDGGEHEVEQREIAHDGLLYFYSGQPHEYVARFKQGRLIQILTLFQYNAWQEWEKEKERAQ
jgi:hypothetical protein